jgi:hypothetical protein
MQVKYKQALTITLDYNTHVTNPLSYTVISYILYEAAIIQIHELHESHTKIEQKVLFYEIARLELVAISNHGVLDNLGEVGYRTASTEFNCFEITLSPVNGLSI